MLLQDAMFAATSPASTQALKLRHCHSHLLHSPSRRFFRSSCLAFPFWCPRPGNSREAAVVDAAFIILHDSQTYSNTGITFDLNILIRLLRILLFQTPVNLPNTALTLPCLEMMSSSASPSVLTLAPKLDLESLLSLVTSFLLCRIRSGQFLPCRRLLVFI